MSKAVVVKGWRSAEIERVYDQAVASDLPLYLDDGRKLSDQPAESAARHRKAYHLNKELYRARARERMKKKNAKRSAMRKAAREALGRSAVIKLNTDFRSPSKCR